MVPAIDYTVTKENEMTNPEITRIATAVHGRETKLCTTADVVVYLRSELQQASDPAVIRWIEQSINGTLDGEF